MTNHGERGSGASGLAGLEMRKELGRFIIGHLKLSEWRIEVSPSVSTQSWRLSETERPIDKREISFGNASITCLEYRMPYYPPALTVQCSGPGGLYASLFGEQRHIPEFYRTLEQITVAGK